MRTDELEALLAGDTPTAAAEDEETRDAEPGVEAPVADSDALEMPGASEMREATDVPAVMTEEPTLEKDSFDDEDDEDGSLDESQATLESHSGEESDDHEGIPAPQ